ncbi:matrin 3-like 1.1 [Tautogolabrus adspersus]
MSHNYPYRRPQPDSSLRSDPGPYSSSDRRHSSPDHQFYQAPQESYSYPSSSSRVAQWSQDGAVNILNSCGLEPGDLALLAEMPEDRLTVESLPHVLQQIKGKRGTVKQYAHNAPSPSSSSSYPPSSTRRPPTSDWDHPPSQPLQYQVDQLKPSPLLPELDRWGNPITFSSGRAAQTPSSSSSSSSYVVDFHHRPAPPDYGKNCRDASPVSSYDYNNKSKPPEFIKPGREGRQVSSQDYHHRPGPASSQVFHNRLGPPDFGKTGRDVVQVFPQEQLSFSSVGRDRTSRPFSQPGPADYRPHPLLEDSRLKPLWGGSGSETSSTKSSSQPSTLMPSKQNAMDFHGTTPPTYPHSCSLCAITVMSEKVWLKHINGPHHADGQLSLLQKFPNWDCRLETVGRVDNQSERWKDDRKPGDKPQTSNRNSNSSKSHKKSQKKISEKSKVVCVKFPAHSVDEKYLKKLAEPFGRIVKILMFPSLAFVELGSMDQAKDMVKFHGNYPPTVNGQQMEFTISHTFNFLQSSRVVSFTPPPTGEDGQSDLISIIKRFGLPLYTLFLPSKTFVEMKDTSEAQKLVDYYSSNSLRINDDLIKVSFSGEYKSLMRVPSAKRYEEETTRTRSASKEKEEKKTESKRTRSSSKEKEEKKTESKRTRSSSKEKEEKKTESKRAGSSSKEKEEKKTESKRARSSSKEKEEKKTESKRKRSSRDREVSRTRNRSRSREKSDKEKKGGTRSKSKEKDTEEKTSRTRSRSSDKSRGDRRTRTRSKSKEKDISEKKSESKEESSRERSSRSESELREKSVKEEEKEACVTTESSSDPDPFKDSNPETAEKQQMEEEAQSSADESDIEGMEVIGEDGENLQDEEMETLDDADEEEEEHEEEEERDHQKDEEQEAEETAEKNECPAERTESPTQSDFPVDLDSCITLDELEEDECDDLDEEVRRESESPASRVLYFKNVPLDSFSDGEFIRLVRDYGTAVCFLRIPGRHGGFIEMSSPSEAQRAIKGLKDKPVHVNGSRICALISSNYTRLSKGWTVESLLEEENKSKSRSQGSRRSDRLKKTSDRDEPSRKSEGKKQSTKKTPEKVSSSRKKEKPTAKKSSERESKIEGNGSERRSKRTPETESKQKKSTDSDSIQTPEKDSVSETSQNKTIKRKGARENDSVPEKKGKKNELEGESESAEAQEGEKLEIQETPEPGLKESGSPHPPSSTGSPAKPECEQKPDADGLKDSEVNMESQSEPTGGAVEPQKPTKPVGTEFVRPVVGYFCNLCQLIYVDEDEAKQQHCSSLEHYRKYQEKTGKDPWSS